MNNGCRIPSDCRRYRKNPGFRENNRPGNPLLFQELIPLFQSKINDYFL